ncbi:hypothetical protein ACFLSJ_04700 [Verrucomicrobiota bacterium]
MHAHARAGRSSGAVTFVLTAAVVLGAALPRLYAQTGHPWPMIRHDPQGTAKTDYLGPDDEPTNLWIRPTLGGGGKFPPVVAENGTVYVGESFQNSPDGTWTYAIRHTDGSLIWSQGVYRVCSGLALGTNGSVFGQYEDPGDFNTRDLCKLRVTDGVLVGRSTQSGWMGSYGTPIVGGNGRLYFANSGALFEAEPANLAVTWWSTNVPASNFAPYAPVMSPDERTIYAKWGWALHAQAVNGPTVWFRYQYQTNYFLPAVGGDGTIYCCQNVNGSNCVVALDQSNGRLKWRYALDLRVTGWSEPIVPAIDNARDVIYVTSGSGKITALRDHGSTVQFIRSRNIPDIFNSTFWPRGHHGPTIDGNGRVYVSANRAIYAFDPELTRERWKVDTPDTCSPVTTAPIIGTDRQIYVGHGDNSSYGDISAYGQIATTTSTTSTTTSTTAQTTSTTSATTSTTSSTTTTTVEAGRVVRVENASGAPDTQVQVRIMLEGPGGENAVGFSLAYVTQLSYVNAVLGSDMPGGTQLNLNTTAAPGGPMGFAVALPAGQSLPSGDKELVVVTLGISAAAQCDAEAVVLFWDMPVSREVVDPAARPLAATWTDGAVTVVCGYEADVAPRPGGNNRVSVGDWTQVGRFAAGLDTAANGSEFQRADCSPRPCGNGRVSIADWTQAGRYAAGLDPVQGACGPTSP